MLATTIKSLEPELNNLLAFGTDDEAALVEGFNQHFEKATHLRCEIHLRKNIETKLSPLGINGQIKATFIWDIFGRKIEGGGEKGVSDASDAAEFSVMLDNILEKWTNIHQNGNEFHSWFKDVKSNAFIEGVIRSVRQRAGLGCPPEKLTTNRSE